MGKKLSLSSYTLLSLESTRVATIPVRIPIRFHFGSDSKIFGYSSLNDS